MKKLTLMIVILAFAATSAAAVEQQQLPAERKGFCEIGCDVVATACKVGCYEACAFDPDPPACRARVAECKAACEDERDACYAECDDNLTAAEWNDEAVSMRDEPEATQTPEVCQV